MKFWLRPSSVLFTLWPGDRVKRQEVTICYQDCNYAEVVGQGIGLQSSICAINSPFQIAYRACQTCLTNNSASSNATLVSKLTGLEIYLNFCKENDAIFVLASATSAAAALSSSQAALSASIASLDSSLSITPSASLITTTSSHASTQPSNLHTLTPITSPKSDTGVIVGAAVGGTIGGILLVGLVISCFVFRRRKKHRAALAAKNQVPEKSQLHSDDYKPPREEMLGTLGKKQYDHTVMSELPSNERVESPPEMPANEEVGAELDNRVKVPRMHVSSQSTRVESEVAESSNV